MIAQGELLPSEAVKLLKQEFNKTYEKDDVENALDEIMQLAQNIALRPNDVQPYPDQYIEGI